MAVTAGFSLESLSPTGDRSLFSAIAERARTFLIVGLIIWLSWSRWRRMLAVDFGLWKWKGSGFVALKWFYFFCSSRVCWKVFWRRLKSGTGLALEGWKVNWF